MAKGGRRANSGRKRKPTELRVLEGRFRPEDVAGPPVQGGFPLPPEYLSEAEARLWARFPKPAWIGETDALAVHAAVSLYARILHNQAAQRATAEAGAPLAYKVSYDGDGNERLEPKPNPLITQEVQLWARLMSVLASLGMTPADRSKVQAPAPTDAEAETWASILG